MPSFEMPDNTIQKSEAEIKIEKEDRRKELLLWQKNSAKVERVFLFQALILKATKN
jgi:hypothetical protein